MPESEVIEREVIFQVVELTGAMQYNMAVVKVAPQDLFYSIKCEGKIIDGKFVVDDANLNYLVGRIRAVAYVEFTD